MAVQAASLQAQPDELIDFSHLKSKRGMTQLELEDEVATDLKRATGLASASSKGSHHLNRVLQLTGALSSALCPHCSLLLSPGKHLNAKLEQQH